MYIHVKVCLKLTLPLALQTYKLVSKVYELKFTTALGNLEILIEINCTSCLKHNLALQLQKPFT